MSNIKRGLQLGAAIVGIVFSVILMFGAILLIQSILSLGAAFAAGVSILLIAYIFVIVFCVALLVISSLICVNPNKRKKPTTHLGLSIAAIVLNALLVITYAASTSLWAIVPAISLGLFIASLCVGNKHKQEPVQASAETTEAPAATAEAAATTETPTNQGE